MNERIRVFAEQAGMIVDKYGLARDAENGLDEGVDIYKFAELIVKECAAIAAEQGDTAEHSFTATRAKWFRLGAIKSATMIKRTFGVER